MKMEIRFSIYGWILQIITWILLILSIIFGFEITSMYLIVTYLFYIIIESRSPTSAYLCNKISSKEIYQKVDKLFNTFPKIEFRCKYEDDDCQCSFLSRKIFKYRFSKDISSPFALNLQNKNLIKKNYIKLRLDEEILFADSETAHEYAIQKSAFLRMVKSQYKGHRIEFVESKHIPGLKNYNLISIKNKEPTRIKIFIFIFFVILTFGELYKIYFNSFCSYQSFTIKKVVTINPYLNQNNFEQGYEKKLSNEQNKLKRHLNISKQTEFSVIKGVVKVTKDIKLIIINRVNTKKQINIEITKEKKDPKNNLYFNNECNKNLKNKDNNGNDSVIIINNKNIYNIDNNESCSVIFVNNKNLHNKDNNESDFVNLINKKNSFDILNNK